MKTPTKKNLWVVNFVFFLACGTIFFFLLRAPEATTPPLPHDDIHEPFYEIASKKEAEKNCLSCHGPDSQAPLSEEHPPKYRCLFCHKRQ